MIADKVLLEFSRHSKNLAAGSRNQVSDGYVCDSAQLRKPDQPMLIIARQWRTAPKVYKAAAPCRTIELVFRCTVRY
jgi:hypothetical protein